MRFCIDLLSLRLISLINTATKNNNYIKTLFIEEAYLTIILDML